MGLVFQCPSAHSGIHDGIEMALQQPFLLRTGARRGAGRQYGVGEVRYGCLLRRPEGPVYNLRWWDAVSGGVDHAPDDFPGEY